MGLAAVSSWLHGKIDRAWQPRSSVRKMSSTRTPDLPVTASLTPLIARIAEVVEQARGHVRQSVNQAMVASYWEIGRLIVEHEQQGQARAAYGQRQLAELSARLTELFGKGFDASNLRNMRRFYLAFPIREAVPLELSWSHYNVLARVENLAEKLPCRKSSVNWKPGAVSCEGNCLTGRMKSRRSATAPSVGWRRCFSSR